MSKANSNGRSKNGYGRYNNYDYAMTLSEAFMSLSGDAVKIFMHIRTRFTEDKHKINNNGKISYGVREGAAVHLSRNRTSRALKELQQRGFLKVREDSTFDQKKLARTWIITCEKYANKQPTRDFKNWKSTPDKKQNTVPPAGQHSPTSGTPTNNKPATVPPAGLNGIKYPPLQSHQRDTYIYTIGGGKKKGNGGNVNDGDNSHMQALRSSVPTLTQQAGPGTDIDLVEIKKRTAQYLFDSGYGSQKVLSEKLGVACSKISRFINKPQSTLPVPVMSKLMECISINGSRA